MQMRFHSTITTWLFSCLSQSSWLHYSRSGWRRHTTVLALFGGVGRLNALQVGHSHLHARRFLAYLLLLLRLLLLAANGWVGDRRVVRAVWRYRVIQVRVLVFGVLHNFGHLPLEEVGLLLGVVAIRLQRAQGLIELIIFNLFDHVIVTVIFEC